MEIVIAEDEGNRRNSALSTWWGDGGPDEQEVLFGMACAWTLRLFQHANSEAVGGVLWYRRDRERATTRDVRCGGEGNPGPSESYEGGDG